MLLTLHRIGSAYGAAPHEVLSWEPWQVGLAIAALNEAMEETRQRLKQGAWGVVPLGGYR